MAEGSAGDWAAAEDVPLPTVESGLLFCFAVSSCAAREPSSSVQGRVGGQTPWRIENSEEVWTASKLSSCQQAT